MDASRPEYYESYDWIDEVTSAILHISGKKVIFYFNNFDNPDDFVTVEAGIKGF